MSLYSVLLVDDEEEVFQAMIKKIDWEQIGFQVTGYARNGEEALEMTEEAVPDVVMSDIKMPYMDGLTLCRKLKERYGNIKVIIFSGFDEFEYAKEAIKLEAEEYILKPINSGELREVFERIKINLDKELDEKRNLDKLRQYYMESLPVMQEQFFVSLIEGKIQKEQIDSYLENFQMDNIKAPYYAMTICHAHAGKDGGWKENPMLLNVSLQKLLEENMGREWNIKIIHYLRDIIVLAMLEKKEEVKKLTDAFDRVCKIAGRMLKVRVFAGVGGVCSELTALEDSYEGALEALEYRVVWHENQAISIEEVEPRSGVRKVFDEQDIQRIIRKIKVGDKEELEGDITKFIEGIRQTEITLQQFRIIVMTTAAEFTKLGNSYDISTEELFKDGILQKVTQLESVDAFGQWFLDICMQMRGIIRQERKDSTKMMIEKAQNYLQEHLGDSDMSIDTICNYLNVSSAYFSTLFKKETGTTVVNYLTKLRMEKAVELLDTTEDKTYVIAEKVGYAEPNYFSYVFKKAYGISPTGYRTAKTE